MKFNKLEGDALFFLEELNGETQMRASTTKC